LGGGSGVYLQQVGEDNAVLERARDPDQIQRILIHTNLLRQRRCVVATKPPAAVWADADAEVAYSDC